MINGRTVGFFAGSALTAQPLPEICGALKAIGYDAVELDLAWLDRCAGEAELNRACGEIRAAGLLLSEVVVQLDYVEADEAAREENISRTIRAVRRCGRAGIKTVNLFTGPRPWIPNALESGRSVSQTQAWDMVFAAFDRIVPAAEEAGVGLAVENVWGMACHDFFTAQFLVGRYGSPSLGVNFDPSHDLLAGHTDMEFLLRQWGDRVLHIHMKDAAGVQERGRVLFPPLGEGLVDWPGFVRGLDAIGYRGALSVEYEAESRLARSLGGSWRRAAEESYRALEWILS